MAKCPYHITRTKRQITNQKRRIILDAGTTSVGFLDPRSFNTNYKARKQPIGVSTFVEPMYGIYVDPNGQYVYGHDTTDNLIRTFEMTTPGDLSTLTDTENNIAEVSATFTNTIKLRDSGAKFYAGISTTGYYAELGTAYDISTLGSASTPLSSAYHFQDLSTDGVHLLIVYPVTTQFAYYQLSTPWDLSTRGAAVSTGTFSPTIGGSYNTWQYSTDGTYLWGTSANNERMDVYSLSTPYDPASRTHLGEFHYELPATAGRSFSQTDYDGQIYVYDSSSAYIYQLGPSDESGAIDEYSTTYESRILNFTSSARSGCWSDHGLYFYYHNSLSNVFGRRTASTAFDPSTLGAEDHTVAEPASTATSEGISICNEGYTAMIAGNGTQISYATMGTPYNISTVGAWSTYAVGCAGGFVMAKHGKTFYVATAGAGTQSIKQYDLSTIWDPSTASLVYTLDISGVVTTTGQPDNISINGQGTKIYALDTGGLIHYWNLSTPWDLSTATYGASIDFGVPASSPQNFYVNQYGDNEVYCWDGTNNDLYKFTRAGG